MSLQPIDWEAVESGLKVDRTVGPVDWCAPGSAAGLDELNQFCQKRLKLFGSKRNDPTLNALSNLSPWFHFGKLILLFTTQTLFSSTVYIKYCTAT